MIVNNEYESTGIGLGAKDLLILAPGRLVSEACTGSAFVTPFVVVTARAGMVFVRFPFTVMVALSVNVQVVSGGRLPPLNEKELSPGVPVSVPPHVPTLKFTGLARIMLSGILSVKAIPVSVAVPGLINSILIVEEAPPVTINGSKPFTNSIARVLPLVMFSVELILPAGSLPSLFVMFPTGIVFT